jgi:tRNA threonylcarbamoyladenosine biosynthesis protein TsaE
MEYISHNLEETKEVALKLLNSLSPIGDKSTATIVGLSGDLGSGKTALTQCLAKHLGVEEHVTSPTFVIMKSYELTGVEYEYKKLIHIDAYRLKNGTELLALDLQKELEKKENLIIIEWAELVKEVLPEDMTFVRCRFIDSNTRQFVW